MDNFIHTHLHTEFSNYGMNDAISSVDDVINRVHSLGFCYYRPQWMFWSHRGVCQGSKIQ